MLVYYTCNGWVKTGHQTCCKWTVHIQVYHFAGFLPLHYALSVTASLVHSFGTLGGPSTRKQSKDKRRWQLCCSCPEMLPASNKWYVRNHFKIESQLSKCQLGWGYMASLPLWSQQLADLFIATTVGMYCTSEWKYWKCITSFTASYLHNVFTVSEV